MNKLTEIKGSFISDGLCALKSVMYHLRKGVLSKWLTLTVVGAVVLPTPLPALNIHVTYNTSVTGLANAAQVETAFAAAAQTIEDLYTNPITVNITVYWGNTGPFSGGVGLGASETSTVGYYTYSELTSGLRAARTTSADSNAVASLPSSNPIAGNQWVCPRAEVKALGLPGALPNDSTNDGSIGFASDVTYTFDPNNRAVAGKYDFIGVAEHEITEVLGRIFGLNYLGNGYVPYDLFRFTGAGTRSFNVNDTNVYFSVDDGTTVLKYFYPDVSQGDVQDWQTSTPPDAFDAFASPGEKTILSSADLTAVDVLGYDLNFASPQLAGSRPPDGTFHLTFTNTPGMGFVILTSTNISLPTTNWTVLGAPTESTAGQYQYIDSQATAHQQRFYRVSLP